MVVGDQFADAIVNHCSSSSPTIVLDAALGTASDDLDHRGEFAFGFDPAPPHRVGSLAPLPLVGSRAGEDAQLVGADTPLADRSAHEPSTARCVPKLMGK
jgi:hypothetical protein